MPTVDRLAETPSFDDRITTKKRKNNQLDASSPKVLRFYKKKTNARNHAFLV